MVNRFLRALFYWPIRITATCEPIPFEPAKHIKIDPNKEIVYIMVSSSVGNMLTVERLTKKLGWPSPFERIKIGNHSLPRTAYLRSPSFFSSNAHARDISEIIYEWFDACHEVNKDIQIIPISVLWSRDPSIEGSAIRGIDLSTPGWRKFLTLTFAGRDNCTIISDPCSAFYLEERLGSIEDEDLRRKTLKRLIQLHFLRKVRTVVGRPFPNRAKLLKELVKRQGTQLAIQDEMKAKGLTQEELEKKAYEIFDIMVADTRYPLLRFFNTIISLVWNRIYHGQNIVGANQVRELVQNGYEIIYIPCHRSHMDYILLLFAIFHEGLPIPQVASGDNLNFFPVGQIIRRCGSYFIRRKMKGDTFYTALFREYLSVLFERGYATEFFIEGGRSRTGRTLPPRTGMVSMTVQAQLRGIERPIAFIPTYLGYEHVMEVGSYMHELEGAKKQKESIKGLLGIFKRIRYYGRGYVTFGEPISVPRFLNTHVPHWHDAIDPTGNARPDWLYDTVNQLSHEIIIKLNDSATVNGINLCALAIIGDADHTLSINMLKRCLKLYLLVLSCDSKRQSMMPTTSVETLISQALELKKFRAYDVGEDMKFVRPSRGQTLQLTYFQNNILHLFALPALIATIMVRNGHISRTDVITHARSLFYFLKHELFVPVSEGELDPLINKYLDVFVQGGYILEQEHEILTLSGDGYEELLILSSSIRLNLVRYLIAVALLKQINKGELSKQEFIDACVDLCHQVPNDVTNNSPEFADPIMFNIMCDTFVRHHYFSYENDKITPHHAKIHRLAVATEPLLAAKLVRHLKTEIETIKRYGTIHTEESIDAMHAPHPSAVETNKSNETEINIKLAAARVATAANKADREAHAAYLARAQAARAEARAAAAIAAAAEATAKATAAEAAARASAHEAQVIKAAADAVKEAAEAGLPPDDNATAIIKGAKKSSKDADVVSNSENAQTEASEPLDSAKTGQVDVNKIDSPD